MSGEGHKPRMEPDWPKVQEVALALLCLGEHHRRDRLRVRPQIPFLEEFESEGWIEDSSTALGWIEITPAGQARAHEMLEKHFGIVIGGDPSNGDQPT